MKRERKEINPGRCVICQRYSVVRDVFDRCYGPACQKVPAVNVKLNVKLAKQRDVAMEVIG